MTEGYLGNQNLKPAGVEVPFSEEDVKEYVKCSQDPVYFVRKYIKIVSLDEDSYLLICMIIKKISFKRFMRIDLSLQNCLDRLVNRQQWFLIFALHSF